MTDTQHVRFTKFHHATFYLALAGTRLLVDPSSISPTQPSLDGVDAILVTHGHADHFNAETLAAAIDAGIDVYGPTETIADLVDSGRVHTPVPGDRFDVGAFGVEVAGDLHAPMHPDAQQDTNFAYVVNGSILVTGDQLAPTTRPITTLIAPASAPWLRAIDLISYVREINPEQYVGIHDALLSELGHTITSGIVSQLEKDGVASAHIASDGESLLVGPGWNALP